VRKKLEKNSNPQRFKTEGKTEIVWNRGERGGKRKEKNAKKKGGEKGLGRERKE